MVHGVPGAGRSLAAGHQRGGHVVRAREHVAAVADGVEVVGGGDECAGSALKGLAAGPSRLHRLAGRWDVGVGRAPERE